MLNLSNPIALVFCMLIIFLGGFYSGLMRKPPPLGGG